MSTPVAAVATSIELFDCMRWMLASTPHGKQTSTEDGISVVGAHVADVGARGATWRVGYVVISICSADLKYYVHDLINNYIDKPHFKLSLHGEPLRFATAGSPDQLAKNIPPQTPAPPAKKRRQDDWLTLLECPNAPFAYANWALRAHRSRFGKSIGPIFGGGPDAPIVE